MSLIGLLSEDISDTKGFLFILYFFDILPSNF